MQYIKEYIGFIPKFFCLEVKNNYLEKIVRENFRILPGSSNIFRAAFQKLFVTWEL